MHLPLVHRESSRHALQLILLALEAPHEDAAQLMLEAQGMLPEVLVKPLALDSTTTKLSVEEVNDYDRYFKLRHIESEIPGISLIKSLLEMLERFMSLSNQLTTEQHDHIEQQKAGIREYTHLLTRVLGLESLE